jgi:hypothetical protein
MKIAKIAWDHHPDNLSFSFFRKFAAARNAIKNEISAVR